ncbi:methyl-accepting chemotaxis protein [Termitidicoccus mucosus]|uniref:Methyl-accepting transducer domain-containing protein n=2 Tax=Termitidicoccus mucosus TaxID=1184151 RepID=A0A178ICJ0_9BACT|nr:hypothetical protein AW736_21050 [Opitutaceae bacterium TSB47]
MTSEPHGVAATPERISELSGLLQSRIKATVTEIERINLNTRLLAFNAQIEAARAGVAGISFNVVSGEMVKLAESIQQATSTIAKESESLAGELAAISRELATSVRGTRLADLAYTNIELIDRNLYERSCDCRWWATDGAVVSVLEGGHGDASVVASSEERLAVILKAYTVYFDIVVADTKGRIVANGHPGLYKVKGLDCSSEPWFVTAMGKASGDDFGFQSVHASALAAQQRALIYSCKVGRGGRADRETIGVLGVVFRWDALAQTIVNATPIDPESRAKTLIAIVDDERRILAATDEALLGKSFETADAEEIFSREKTSMVGTVFGRPALIAHALSPGYETYRTGWHSLIVEYRNAS